MFASEEIPTALLSAADDAPLKSDFVPYEPTLLIAKKAPRHPSDIVESASLASIKLPNVEYKPSSFVYNGCISSLQLEAVLLACHRHEIFHGKVRHGILIGDGTGVGKGRIIAAIVAENYMIGRKKSLWFSSSLGLVDEMREDLKSLNLEIQIPVIDFNKAFKKGLPNSDGCLFVTYSAFSRKTTEKVKQILSWLGKCKSCVVALDESHTIKNVESLASQAICILNSRLPKARFVYASATAVESADELMFMNRLFLWGPGTTYPGFAEFQAVIKNLGYLGMETIAMELKHRGSIVARRLDFSKSQYILKEVSLTYKKIDLYNKCVEIWMLMKDYLTSCVKKKRGAMRLYYREQQSFFKMLCVALKVDFVIEYTRKQVNLGHAVVIGLLLTGESAYAGLKKSQPLSRLPSPLKSKLLSMVAYLKSMLSRSEMKTLHQKISLLHFPMNSLDYIVQELGEENVSELTGRLGRYEVYRSKESNKCDKLVWKKFTETRKQRADKFMDGKTNIAIISTACSTGISLHASKCCKNQRKRIHITIDLPWSADAIIQQCGRTLRSNQSSSPIFVYVIADCAGEKRFGYSLSERLRGLGAITQGDRNYTGSGIETISLNTKYALEAISYTLQSIACIIPPVLRYKEKNMINFFKEAFLPLWKVGVFKVNCGKPAMIYPPCTVEKFLNRILCTPLPTQNLIFQYFLDVYKTIISHWKKLGKYEEGILDISQGDSFIQHYKHYRMSDTSVTLYNIMVDYGVSMMNAVRLYEQTPGSQFFVYKNKLVYLAVPDPSTGLYTRIFAYGFDPEKAKNPDMTEFVPSSPFAAKSIWDENYKHKGCRHMSKNSICMIGPTSQYCPNGNRFRRYYVISGIMWSNLQSIHQVLKDSKVSVMQLVRFVKGDKKFIGIHIRDSKYKKAIENISAN